MTGKAIREALEPFAKEAEDWLDTIPDHVQMSAFNITLGDLRRARTAYDAIGSGVKALEREPTADMIAAGGRAIEWCKTFTEDGECDPARIWRVMWDALPTHTAAGAGPVGETYYDKGKDADYFERLNNKDFAWALYCAEMDLNDSAENVSSWMPVSALLGGAAERIKTAFSTIERIKMRLHFMCWPAEAMWNAGTEDVPFWKPDWRYEIALIENALNGSPITAPEKPADTVPANMLPRPTGVGPVDEDDITDAIADSFDEEWTARDAAKAVMALLAERRVEGPAGAVGEAVAWIVALAGDNRFRCFKDGLPSWTDDRERATRYARREDAEAAHQEDDDVWRVLPYAARPADEPVEVERLVEETGSSSVDDLRDMALVGHSLMEVIGIVTADGPYKDWTPAEDPAEIVTDLINDLEEARQAIQEDGETIAECVTRAETAEAALAETRERLEKVLRPLREDLANACSSETIVRRYHVQCVDAALAAITDDAQEAGR